MENLSLIIEYLHLYQLTKCQKGVCGNSIRQKNAEAHDLRTCSVKDSLRGTKVQKTGNHSIKHQFGCSMNCIK